MTLSLPEAFQGFVQPPPPFIAWLPPITAVSFFGVAVWQWLVLAVGLILGWAVAGAVTAISFRLLTKVAGRTRFRWDDSLTQRGRRPTRFLVWLMIAGAVIAAVGLTPAALEAARSLWRVAVVAALVWYAILAVDLVVESLESHATAGAETDQIRLRGLRTQASVLRRVAHVVACVLGAALVLTQFEVLRSVGVSLLASAGVAGVVVGLAAQKSIGSLFAGIQLSITQPIRIGDAVLVEGEFGFIEEITLTYVVVRIWDERRLVVPITRFLEEPFQNWTKSSTQLLGAVMIYADYGVPLDLLRAEIRRFVEGHELWDGRVFVLQVTDLRVDAMEMRVLVSARNAGEAWDLRCAVREHAIAYLSHLENGRYLPRRRIDPGDAAVRTDDASGNGQPRETHA